MKKLSICIPSIRPNLWHQLYTNAHKSACGHPIELIFVGPEGSVDGLDGAKYIQDYGAPTRCVQLGATVATGEWFGWVSDDGVFLGKTLRKSIKAFSKCGYKDAMALKYCEGEGFHIKPYFGNHPDKYWNITYASDMKNSKIPQNYKVILLGMMNLKYFKELGGFDCRYEHLNLSIHDLAFRIQNDGGVIHLSPEYVLAYDCPPMKKRVDYKPVNDAYYVNDAPLFKKQHIEGFDPSRIHIDFDNWKQSPNRWRRFDNG